MSNKPLKPDKPGKAAFQLETLEKRILFSADLPFPVAEFSSLNTTGYIGLVSAAESLAQSSTSPVNSEQHSQATVEIVIIDSATPDYESIVADLEKQANSALHVVILEADRDGIEQISEILSQFENVGALHLVSHGADGELMLGNSTVDFTELLVRADEFAAWQDSFTADADLLIYGCDLASTDIGRSFVSTLGNLTGTDVAASDDLTGSTLLGGDWDLEFRTGAVETKIALSDAVQTTWNGVLSATIDSSSSGSTTGSILTISHTTSGTERLMIVGVSMDAQTSASVSSVTYNGSALTLVGTIQDAGSNVRVELWQMVAPATGTNDVIVTFSQAMTEGGIAGVVTFNGVDQTTPLGSFASAGSPGNGINASLNVIADVGDLVFSTMGLDGSSDTALNEAGGQTEHWEIFQLGTEGAGSTKVATSTSENMSWTFASNQWAIGGVAIKASHTPVAVIDGYNTNLNETLNVDWWNTNWTARQNLTFNNLAQTENLANFPVLVVLNSSNIDYSKTQNNGADLRFMDADGTMLAHEIETWNESGDSYVWVKIPQVDGSSNTDGIVMYYGNASATDTQDSSSVWDNGFASVWHLDNDPSSGAGAIVDSSANPLDGTAANMDATNLVAGKIGNAISFDGSAEFIRIDSSATDKLAITGTQMTVEAWVKRDGTTGNWMVMVNRQLGTDWSDSYFTGADLASPDKFVFAHITDSAVSSAGAIPDATWQYLTAVHDGSDLRVYSNGILVGTLGGVGAITTDDNDVIIGGGENDATSTITEFFKGLLDEIRISDVARSADWIAAQHASMNGSFVSFGGEELAPASGGVTTNDTDPQRDVLTATLVSGPSNAASFTFNTDGTFSYTPTLNFIGVDTFTYKVNDGSTDSNVETVSITVGPSINFSIGSTASISEDLTEQSTFNVTLAGDALVGGNTGSVEIIASGTALSGTDYDNFITAITNAAASTTGVSFDAVDTLTFDSTFNGGTGQGIFSFTVDAIDDIAQEGSETITAILSNPTLTGGTATFGTVFDSFTETSNTPITAHVSDTGNGWTEVFDSSTAGTDATIDAALDVLNGGSDENSVGQAYTAGPAPTNVDQTISFTLSAIDTTTGTKPVGVFGRYVDNDNFYYLQVLTNGNPQDSLQLAKMEGGVVTTLGSIDVTITAGDTFKLEITDATKKIYHNGIEVISSTDNSLTAVGDWGLYFGDFNGIGGHLRDTWGIDDFLAEDSASTAIATTLITETDVNNAPILSGANNLSNIDEDQTSNNGTLVSSLISGQVSDVDSGALEGIAVISVDNTNGSWEYTTDGGSNWLSLGAPTSSTARLLSADANTSVRFVPDANWSGTVTNAIAFHAWDRTSGSSGAIADITDTSGTYLDNFSSVSYSNTDGTLSWATSWIEDDSGGGGATSGKFFVASPVLNVGESDPGRWIYRETDLSGATSATFTFDLATNSLGGSGSFDVQVSGDGGSTFTTLTTITKFTPTGSFSFDISSYISSNTQIRFLDNNGGGKEIQIDNVQIAVVISHIGGTTAFSTASDTASLTVDPVNDGPTITSTAGTAATEDTLYTYTATVTDPDDANNGTDLTWSLSGEPAGMVVSSTGVVTWTPAEGVTNSGAVTLTVSDGNEDGAVDATEVFTITVTPVNDGPVITSTAGTAATEDTLYTYTATVTDPDDANNGTDLTWSLSGEPAGMVVSSTGVVTWTPAEGVTTSGAVTLTVSDGNEDGAVDATEVFTISVTPVNDGPTITSTAGTTATEDTLYTYSATVTDPDDANNGTDLTWSLSGAPTGMVVSSTGVVTWTPSEGVTTSGAVTLTVSDGNEDGAIDATEVFTISVTPVNDGPTITSTAGTAATEDTLYTYTATVTDPDDANNGTDLTWSLSGEPAGMVVNSTGVVTWTPAEGVTTSGAVTLTVSDGNEDGAVDATEVFTITVTPVNDGPTITSTAGTTATEDTLYTYTATVTDPDDANNGTDLTWSLSGAPAGMIVSSTGVVTWTPAEGVTTSGAVTLTVSDGNEDGAVDATEVFTISVTPVNDGPTITSTAGTTATEDTLYTYSATVTDPDDANNGTDLTWSLSGAPTGMVVSSTGVVTWTPSEGVTTSGAVTLTVSDGNEDGAIDATEVFTITVTPVNDSPTITSTAGTAATEDTLYTYTATVTDPDDANNGTDLTWSLSGEPAGMVVSSTGVVTWTPAEGVTTSGAVTLTVSDGNEDGAVDATEVFTITVTPVNDGPTITNTAGTTATEDTLYTYSATVTDPDDANNGTDLTWSLSGEPAGMVVSSTGVVTWTPAEGVTTSGAVTLTVSDGNEDGAVDATEVFTITVTPVNDGPVITSTAGTAATEDTLYTYTATVSDPDDANNGTDLTWSLSGAPTGMVVSSTGVVTWTPAEGVTTSGAVTLTVSDGNEDGAVDATEVFTITVAPVNDGPVITSTAGTAATEDTLYTYTATVTDPDDANNGTDLTWSLSGAPAGMVVSSTGVVTWTPAEGVTTSGAVTLTVSDGNEDGAVDATEVFTITVTPVNDGPTITSTAGTTATEDTLYTYTATVTDPDDANNGTDLTWSLSGAPAGMVVSSTGVVTWTPAEGVTTSGAVTLTVSDGNEDGAVDATEVFTITVTPVNDGPVITSTAGTAATEDTLYTYTATVSDPDDANNGTDLTWSLSGAPAGMVVSSTGVVTWTPTEGVTTSGAVTLTVSDGNEDGAVDATEVFTITVTPVNDGPVITSTAGTTATEDTLYTYTATVSDPDDANNGTDLTWSLSGAPTGMVVSSTGVVTWTPAEGVTTSGAVTLTVSDGNEDGAVDATEMFTITVTPVNDGPVITSTAGTAATEDTLYTYTATVSDPDDANNGTDLTWSLSGAPAGMVVSSTGVVTWNPAEGVTTSGAVTLTVSDGNEDGAVDATEVFTISVTPVNDGPTITSTAGTTATEDTLYTYSATVTDPDDANNGTDLTWSLSGEPAGMVVSSTGVVTWTPAEGVTTSGAVTLTVSDGNEDGAVDATEMFTITVTPVNDGPVITSTAGTTATEDTLYTYTATVSDPDDANNGTDLTWSLSGAPAGMVVSSTGVVTWTPTEGVTTSGAVTLTVSDGNEDGAVDATEVFTITVTPVNDGPVITSTAGTTATEDTLYTYTATVSDPDDANNGTDLTWSLSGEPAGMVVSSTGVVTWTPAEGVTTSGAVTLTVSDGNEDGAVDATEVFTITVTPVNDGPTITSTAGTTATEDTLYTYTATVTDPDDANNGTDLTWSLSGAPAGMVVSSTGVVTWTPAEGVTTSGAVTLTVSDGNEDGAVDATEVFTITVTPVNHGPTITSTAGTAATEDTLYTYTATVSDPDDANNGTDLTWSLSGEPAGMVVSSTGVVTWTPAEGVTTSGAVTLTVSDGNEDGAVDATEVFTITVTPVNDGPTITSTAGTTATEDTLYTYTATVTDPDDANNGTDLTWSLSSAPAGMVVSSTGVVTWTPTEGVTTSGAVTLTVSDGNEDGAVDATEVFTITVTPVNDGPVITSTAGTTATEDTLYTYTATVSDPDDANNGTDLTWSLSGAPAGMVVSSTGVVTWNPAEGVTTSGAVTLTVSDGNEDGAVDATEVFTISVTPVNDGPTITSTAGTTATEDTLYTYSATVTDPDDANNGTDLTWSLSGAPTGMVVSSTGVVTWTPAEGVTTSGAVTLTVSDGNEDGAVDATEVFTITVTPVNDGPVITSTAGTAATEDTLYTYTATVSDPDDANNGTDLTWSLSGAPAGMVVSSTGVVTWNPAEGVTTSGAVTLTVSDGNEDGAVDATEVFTISVTPVNDGPTITSTAGTTATEDTLYTYSATVTDPDDANNGTDLTWSLSGAPTGMVVSSTGVVTWTPAEGVTTSGAVTLTVSDGNEDGAVDATEVFTITVTPVNDGPVITSMAGTAATEDTLYTYTATVSDPDDANNGTDLTWSLSGAPAGMVVSSTGVVTWTPAEGVTTSGAVTLTVSDGNEDGAVDATEVFTITVTPVNDGPTITSTAGTTATEDTLYTYTATVSDPDDANNGTDLTWSLSGAPTGMVVSSTGVVTWTPAEGVTTSGAVTLTVSDGNEDGAVDATEVFTITVTPVNHGPTITSTAGTAATEDTLYTYTATVSDPDDANNGTDLTWSLSGAPTGMVVSSTGVVIWTPAEGVTTSGAVTLTVSDGNEDGAVDATEMFTITVTPVNDGPVITSTAGTAATEDTLYTYTATVSDPDDANNGTDLTWSLSGAPAGMVVSSTGVVTWNPAEGVTTSGAVTLTVSDGNEDGAVDATEVFTITVTPVNDGPTITSTAGTTATEDTLYTYSATVTDPDDANNGTDLTWSLSGEPAGMVVSSTGVVTWTPAEGVTTSGAVTLTVSDGNEDGAVDATEVFTITVTPVNDGPVITSTAGTAATEDTLYTYTATVTDPDDANNGTDLTWSLSGAPTGMVVSSTGVVTWTPAEGVTTSGAVTLTVSDGNEDGAVDATEVFTITVTPVNDGPVITSTAGTTATEDTLYTYTATVSDPDDANNGTDLTWSLSGEPAGMVVSSTGVVTWTPAEGVTTSGAVTLTVSDGNEDGAIDATEVFTITVAPVNDGPVITSTAGTAATEDTLYTYTATVTDPDDANNGTDLTWSLSGAPTGMVVSSTGVVTWTPAEGVTTSGAVTLTVSDGNEDGAVDATEVFTITVTPVNDGPVITSTAGTAATEDTLYTYTATVSDPDDANNGTDLTWSLSGAPAGMVVSSTGVVTWTPAEGVTTSGAVTLTVSDGNEDGAVDATEVFTITVTPVNHGPTITSTAGTTATEDTLYTYTATVTDPDDANNGTYLTWSLSGAPAGMVVSSTGVVTWTPAEGVTTSGAVTLTVSDGNEDGAVDATEVFTITVTPVNHGPTITSTAGTTATEDTLYTYTATVTDPDDANNGTYLTWSLSGAPAGMVVSSTGVVTWTPAEGVTTSGAVTLTVSDGNEDGAVDATEVFTITVTPVNDGPVITSTAGTAATEDTLYTYTATVSDPDDANNGTDLTWSLSGAPAGMVVSSTGVVTWTPAEGVTTSGAVTLTVSDGNEDGAVDATEVFTITVTPVNHGPTITSTAGTTATEDTLYTYTATVTDPDDANNGTYLTWSLSGAPAGMVVSSTGVVTWTPAEGVTTSGAVTLTVSDGNEDGAVDATEVFTITVAPVNDGPVITSTAGTAATEDTLYTYTATVTDPDDANNGTDLTWSLSGEPAGMVVSSTGVVTWTPAEGVTTSGAVTLTVSDGNEDGAVDATEEFTISVTPVNDGPVITSTAGTAATEDTLYTYTATVTDPDDANNGTDLTWSLSSAPAGMVVSSTGVVTWTPTKGVTTSGAVTLTVSDGNEDGAVDATEVFTITVTPVNDVPVTTGNTVIASEDVPLVIGPSAFSFTDVEGDSLNSVIITDLTLNGGTLTHSAGTVTVTNGMTITAAELADLTFTSALNNSTDSSFTYTVNDSGTGVTSAAMNITVNAVNDAPTFTSPTTFTVAENTTSVATLTSSDVDGAAPTYSLVGSADDDRFIINATTGDLRFLNAPDFENAIDAGADNTYNVSVQVSDGRSAVVTQAMMVTVNDVNEAPSLAAVELTATEGFVGNIGQLIMTDPDAGDELTLSIVGGNAQAFFSVDPSSGAISQVTSLSPGIYTLEVQLNDANGMTINALLQIRIDAAEPDLGAANNAADNAQPDREPFVTTDTYSNYAPLTFVIDTPAHPVIQTIAENGDTAGLTFASLLEEPASEASSSTSATGNAINTLFPANSPATHHFSDPSNATVAERTDSQSRSYSLVLELLFGEAEEAFDELGYAFASVMDSSLFSITLTPDMLNALSSMHSDVDEQQQQADERLGLILKVGTVASVTFTVGFVTWLLQTGSLLATALSTSPLWRAIDPVPVLKASQDSDEDRQPGQQRTGTNT